MIESYPLTDAPWIPVVTVGGEPRVLSLRGIFDQAEGVGRLDGDLPTQDAALLRLLVSIVLVAVADPDRTANSAIDEWQQWWHDWPTLNGLVQRYLEQNRHRFDVMDPERPFMQARGLEPAGQLPTTLEKLDPEIGQWFSTREGVSTESMTLAEATRKMLEVQAYGVAGIQTGAAGDPAVKGGKGYPTGYPAWAGNLSLLLPTGKNLAQTLLLNTPLRFFPDEQRAGYDIIQPTFRRDTERPRGAADLLTWPNRRLRLHVGRDRLVHRVQVSYGDTLTPQNLNWAEPMCAWRMSDQQTKKEGHDVLMPVMPDAKRQVWRGLAAHVGDRDHRPITLQWLDELRLAGILDPRQPVTWRVIGVEYGPQNSSVKSIIDESFSTLLAGLADPAFAALAISAVDASRGGAGALTYLASLLVRATGASDEERARDRAAAAGYAALDPVYRSWLVSLADSAQVAEGTYERHWHILLRQTLFDVGRRLVAQAGPRATMGRIVDGRPVNSGSAWRWFTSKVYELTPLASPPLESSTKSSDPSATQGSDFDD